MPSPRPLIPFISHKTTVSSLLFVLSLLLFVFYSLHYKNSLYSQTTHRRNQTSRAAARLRYLSLSAGSNYSISAHLRALTAGPHLAGTQEALSITNYVLRHLRLAGLETHVQDYRVLLSYPLNASLSLHSSDGELLKPLALAEPADMEARVVPPYHAYAPSGAVFAPVIYANYGSEDDYDALEELGVEVRGKVIVVRSGEEYRGKVIERAEKHGAVAVLIFGPSDGAVQRGTVLLGGPGDPLTPGWAATDKAERLSVESEEVKRRFPMIPSMPISAGVSAEILGKLKGPPLPRGWYDGADRLEELGIEVNGVGPGPVVVNFTYQEDKRLAVIRDVFAVIKGIEEPDHYVILGNHRDAWTYGAVDPNSGTAALLDVARRYGVLLQSGWRPRRTIILCSWDAEEFGMIGSTEWVEQNIASLGLKAVAYLNVDCAVQGPGFFADATPQLDLLLIEVMKQVNDPDSKGRSIYPTVLSANEGISIGRLSRSDSDFSSFLHHAGIPSIDMHYGEEFPVYHTALDSYHWMEKYGDPLFYRHVTVAEIWGLLSLHLADNLVLPFNYISYATQLKEYASVLQALWSNDESLQSINISIAELAAAANEAQKQAKELEVESDEVNLSELRRQALNDRLMRVEHAFLENMGLKDRQWFKHLVYSPSKHKGGKLTFFPGIADAIYEVHKRDRGEGAAEIRHEIWRVARGIQKATGVLRGDPFLF